jgi:hypothetical protein
MRAHAVLRPLAALAVLAVATSARAQAPVGFLTGPTSGDPLEIALRYLHAHASSVGLTEGDLDGLAVTDRYVSAHTGVTHIYLRQRIGGVEVFNGNINVNVTSDGRVFGLNSGFVPNAAARLAPAAAQRSPQAALQSAAQSLGLPIDRPVEVQAAASGPAQRTLLASAGGSRSAIPARLVYQPTAGGGLRLAWNIEIELVDGSHWWLVNVDALTGDVLETIDYVANDDWSVPAVADAAPAPPAAAVDSGDPGNILPIPPGGTSRTTNIYRVFARPNESPNHGARTLEVGPADPLASPFGWHDTDGVPGPEFTITRGNNVHAYTDLDANNLPDPDSSPDGGPNLVFDFPLDLTKDTSAYRPAAVANLFYWANMLHDVSYHYGFDEAGGNFQVNNYGRGGIGNDDVRAEAQDASGTNNANFSTPPDGSRPRMQMFIWTRGAANAVSVTSGALVGRTFTASGAAFGNALLTTGPITADVVVANDGVGTVSDACEPLVGFPPGAIALVDRGTCTSTQKVKNAQNAGAVAVIIGNNAAGGTALMSGFDPTVTIPSIMVTLANATLFKANLPFAATLLGNPTPNRDGDLDAGVISHEYTHGISNRLTGGPSTTSCLGNAEQMGEGWSDWFSMAMTARPEHTATTIRGEGTYVIYQPTNGGGIRPAPYTTNMAVNPVTYGNIPNLAIPHGVGYAWASMLWEVYWNLVNVYGFNPDLTGHWSTGGNNLAVQLVIDGMKLQPCRPGFVDGRNAILQADMVLTGGLNQCLIWRGFAKRGLGFSASQGLSTSTTDGVQAFDLPPACQVAPPPNPGGVVLP